MSVEIRPFTAEDYEAIVEIGNRLFPEYPSTVEETRHEDEHRDPKCKFARFVAELDDRVVGFARYAQSSVMYHPQKFEINVQVAPEHQGRGIGKALYEHLLKELEPFDPIKEPEKLGVVDPLDEREERSVHRWERSRALLGMKPSITREDLLACLRDHDGHPFSICRHPGEKDPEERYQTVVSVLMDLHERKMWIGDGPPCTSDYQEAGLAFA